MKPILFNTDMVRALLEGRKSVTRRVVKGYALEHLEIDTGGSIIGVYDQYEGSIRPVMDFAPYHPGDILYVRETWAVNNITPNDSEWMYKADYDYTIKPYKNWRWRPSIHMPKGAARLFLRVTAVRVERLQDITPEQAMAEGCDGRCSCPSSGSSGSLSCVIRDFSVEKFETVWDGTIKPADRDRYGWDANPWVWVIKFERISKEAALEGGGNNA